MNMRDYPILHKGKLKKGTALLMLFYIHVDISQSQ